jgi:hypothetical protein
MAPNLITRKWTTPGRPGRSFIAAVLTFRARSACSAVLADQVAENQPALDPGSDIDRAAGPVWPGPAHLAAT